MLVFTDPPRQQILQWTSKDGLKVRRESSGGAAGVAFDDSGRLLVAERGSGHVTRIDDDGRATVDCRDRQRQADRHADRSRRGPRWVVLRHFVRRAKRAGSYGSIRRGRVTIAAADLLRPSGLALSPDDKTLYVSDGARAEVRAYPRQPDGALGPPRRLAVVLPWKRGVQGRPNGLTVDTQGRLYLAGPGGIWVLDANGGRLGVIATPGNAVRVRLRRRRRPHAVYRG